MRLVIDTEKRSVIQEGDGTSRTLDLYSAEAFELLTEQWVKVGWNRKYSYQFTWLGRPIIQLPEDIVRVQEAIHQVQPDVIVETGVAHGGSLILYAGLCRAMGKGRVVGVDIEIRSANRSAIESHPLHDRITLIEGSSVAPATVKRVAEGIRPGERVMVLLDSCHTKAHVLGELEAYGRMVSPGSYLVATDGVMKDLHDTPHGNADWREDNPVAAVEEFLPRHPEFVCEAPPRTFDESGTPRGATYWPRAWLRRIR